MNFLSTPFPFSGSEDDDDGARGAAANYVAFPALATSRLAALSAAAAAVDGVDCAAGEIALVVGDDPEVNAVAASRRQLALQFTYGPS